MLTPEAKKRFVALTNEFAATAEGVDGGPMSAVLPKAVRFALRLALIDHCLRHADAKTDPTRASVSDESMGAGEILARWFVHEAERVYAICAEEPADRANRTLADWIRRRHPDGVTTRTVQRNRNQYKTAAAAEAALHELVKAGLGSWSERRPGPEGGAPTRVFTLVADLGPAAPDTQHAADATPGEAAHDRENAGRDEVPSVPSVSVRVCQARQPTGAGTPPRRGKRRYSPDDTPHDARTGTPEGGA